MSKHTQTPWAKQGLIIVRDVKTRSLRYLIGDFDSTAAMSEEEKHANGEFIVTACNAYDDNQQTIAELTAALDYASSSNTVPTIISTSGTFRPKYRPSSSANAHRKQSRSKLDLLMVIVISFLSFAYRLRDG